MFLLQTVYVLDLVKLSCVLELKPVTETKVAAGLFILFYAELVNQIIIRIISRPTCTCASSP